MTPILGGVMFAAALSSGHSNTMTAVFAGVVFDAG